MRDLRFLAPGLLVLPLVVACGGNVVLDTPGAGGSGTGSAAGGSGVGGSGIGGSGSTLSTSSGPGNPGISCDFGTGASHVCETYYNLPASQMMAVESACSSAMGTVLAGCPSTDRLGTCSVSQGGITAGVAYYGSSGVTADQAQMACTASGGTWTAG
jgi:hypothetical protein